jgi:Family of unknown function (DUF6152)
MTSRERATMLVATGMCLVLLELAPLQAHHSMAMYDQKNITITGIVKRVDLRNPHSLFYITVTDAQGNQAEWVLEAQPLTTLAANGWSATTMKIGDKVTAAGSPARNGKPFMLVRAFQLPDGRTISTDFSPGR